MTNLLTTWQWRLLIMSFSFFVYMIVGVLFWLIAFAANIGGGVVALLGDAGLGAGISAIILSPTPIAALIIGFSDGNWLVAIFNIPFVAFLISMPFVSFILKHIPVIRHA